MKMHNINHRLERDTFYLILFLIIISFAYIVGLWLNVLIALVAFGIIELITGVGLCRSTKEIIQYQLSKNRVGVEK